MASSRPASLLWSYDAVCESGHWWCPRWRLWMLIDTETVDHALGYILSVFLINIHTKNSYGFSGYLIIPWKGLRTGSSWPFIAGENGLLVTGSLKFMTLHLNWGTSKLQVRTHFKSICVVEGKSGLYLNQRMFHTRPTLISLGIATIWHCYFMKNLVVLEVHLAAYSLQN